MSVDKVEKIENTEAEHELVSCEVCMKSIPKSESKSAEAEEYVAYFCGLECFDQWSKAAEEEK